MEFQEIFDGPYRNPLSGKLHHPVIGAHAVKVAQPADHGKFLDAVQIAGHHRSLRLVDHRPDQDFHPGVDPADLIVRQLPLL